MHTRRSILIRTAVAFALTALAGYPASPSEYALQVSPHTLTLREYEQQVTVRAPLEQVLAYLSDPKNLNLSTTNVSEGAEFVFGPQGSPAGTFLPFTANRLGFKFEGKLILVRNDRDNAWFLWDTPQLFQFRKWKFGDLGDSTLITIDSGIEIPQGAFWSRVEPVTRLVVDKSYQKMDEQLAAMQALFDPSLDQTALTEVGLRGEIIDTLYPAHRAETPLAASVDEAARWLDSPGQEYLEGMKSEGGCLYGPVPENGVLTCEAVSSCGGVDMEVKTFIVVLRQRERYTRRLYLVSPVQMGLIEIEVEKSKGGSKLIVTAMLELPVTGTSGMDTAVYMADLPQKVGGCTRSIKQGIETARAGQ